ncbi:hypothetical protein [Streptomyces longwoodensis]|uniref:hypothetical protein n=1 Tax=Streptomyces longwoodensis TaxID=68231 RepID=UPI002251806D|nr:hypothetical protein [Streptomyces longwoodensis]MCX4993795.1 hypothetical protein [Streptomyces longwoodensis]MCX4998085.1 hypothetical protein [Streptomyces longwoodensis]
MDQATQATTPTAPTQSPERTAYKRASATTEGILDQLTALPRSVEICAEFAGGYGARLHFGSGITAARGVLEVAGITGTEPTRDTSAQGLGIYLELHATVEGISLVARALLDRAEADQLLQQTPEPAAEETAPVAPPVPLGSSVLAQARAVTPIAPAGGVQ